jgi:hypothetical protein
VRDDELAAVQDVVTDQSVQEPHRVGAELGTLGVELRQRCSQTV